jgi:hypothetical protein
MKTMSSHQTFWHSAASLLQRIGDASLARARSRAIAQLDSDLRKDIGWPGGETPVSRHPML